MIEYNPRTWFAWIFSLHRSDTLRILFPEMVAVALYSAGLVYTETALFPDTSKFKSTTAVHSLVGVVLGLLLVFRTNTGYERWWEGRRLWGELVNSSRSLAMKLNAVLPEERQDLRRFFAAMIPNYALALKDHLRGGARRENLEDAHLLAAVPEGSSHLPNRIATQLYQGLEHMRQSGLIDSTVWLGLDQELRTFTNVAGACERIRNTPIPFSYSIFIKKFLFIYTLTLPIGFVYDFQYWAVPISVFLFYVLVSLEILAEEIEDPFGTEANDLPTDDLAARIRQNVRDILGGSSAAGGVVEGDRTCGASTG